MPDEAHAVSQAHPSAEAWPEATHSWDPAAAKYATPALLIVPAILVMAFLAVPLVAVVLDVNLRQLPELLSTSAARDALQLSLITCLSSTALCVFAGVPLALLLAQGRDSWWMSTIRTIATMPMVLPPVVAGLALLITWGRRGLLGQTLAMWGIDISFSTIAVILAQTFVALPFFLTSFEGSLRTRGFTAEHTARLLGASRLRTLTHITLPLSLPGLMSATALACARCLGEFGATITFAGSLQGVTRTLPLEIYLQTEAGPELALALALILIIAAVLLLGAASGGSSYVYRRMMGGPRRADMKGPAPSSSFAAEEDEPAGGAAAASDGAAADGDQGRDAVGPKNTLGELAPLPPGPAVRVSAHIRERNLDVEHRFAPGSKTAIMGENGTGKSTLITLLCGMFTHDEARVRWETADKPRIAVLAQNPHLFPHLSAVGNISFALRSAGVSKRDAREIALRELRALAMADFAERRPHQLSGGQAQRVALARALAVSAQVLLLDEPLVGIDQVSAGRIRKMLAARTGQATLIMVTHQREDVEFLADHIIRFTK